MEWLNKLVDLLVENCPLIYVNANEGAVRTVWGRPVWGTWRGLVLQIPFITHVEKRVVVGQVIRFGPCPLRTKDGRSLAVGGGVEYRIEDLTKYVFSVRDPDESCEMRIVGAVARFVAEHDLAECTSVAIEAAIEEALKFSAKNQWGIRVLAVAVRDNATAKPIMLLQHETPVDAE